MGGERGETEMQRSPPRRGTYITFLEGFHGQGAVGAMSLTVGRKNLGATWQGGFDVWATATDLARDRHGFEPLSAGANGVFEQTACSSRRRYCHERTRQRWGRRASRRRGQRGWRRKAPSGSVRRRMGITR